MFLALESDTGSKLPLPFKVYNRNRSSRIVLVCDHATNHVPQWLNGGSLGLNGRDMGRHVALDVGAAGVTRHLADTLGATAVLSNFSRLVIDANRGETDPTLIMQICDGIVVPANRSISSRDRKRRLNRCHRPYHGTLSSVLDEIDDPVVLSIHSFTPRMWTGPKRPWNIGVLSSTDRRIADPLLALLNDHAGLVVGDNRPYAGRLPGDTIDRHAFQSGRPHALIEIRNDQVEAESSQLEWAEFLAPILRRVVDCATGSVDCQRRT